MEYETRKQKYLDKLKKASSRGLNDNTGLLAKVERYNKENPVAHITKDRLTIKRNSSQYGFQSNKQNRNVLNPAHRSRSVHDLENIINSIKSKRKLVSPKSDSKTKFDPSNFISTTIHQQTNYSIISKKKNNEAIFAAGKNSKCGMNEKMNISEYYLSNISSPLEIPSPKIIKNKIRGVMSTSENQKLNKNNCLSLDGKAKLNLYYSFYMTFINSHCDEIKHISETIYPDNDYSVKLKKQLQQAKLKYQNEQDKKNTYLMKSSSVDFNNTSIDNSYLMSSSSVNFKDSSIDSFKNISSASIPSCNDFSFKPIINFSNSPAQKSTSQLFQNSFVGSTQRKLFINTDNSIDIDQVSLKLNEGYISSPEICMNINDVHQCKEQVIHYQSRLTYSQYSTITTYHTNYETTSKKLIQKSKNKEKSKQEDSFKYYKKKMF